jgi:renalase
MLAHISGFFMTVAIIGAGMAGLACARTLADRGAKVRLFEKSRGLGGRCATRRDALHGLQFDHGVQFVRAKGGAFGAYLDGLRADGTAMHWPAADGDGKKAYVTVPGMSALARPVAQGLDVTTASRIISMSRVSIGWTLIDESGASHGPFDAVILAIPAPQAAELLGAHRFGARLRDGVTVAPCLAAMLQFASDAALPDVVVPPPGTKDQPSLLSWIARDSAKPGHEPGKSTFVVHAARSVSQDWLEREPSEIAVLLETGLRALARQQTGTEFGETLYRSGHRWRLAFTTRALREPCLWDADWRLGVCGDFCLGDRVRHAFQSGVAMADTLAA